MRKARHQLHINLHFTRPRKGLLIIVSEVARITTESYPVNFVISQTSAPLREQSCVLSSLSGHDTDETDPFNIKIKMGSSQSSADGSKVASSGSQRNYS